MFAQRTLESSGYDVKLISNPEDTYLDIERAIRKYLYAEHKSLEDEFIEIYEFDSTQTAKKYCKYLKQCRVYEIINYKNEVKLYEYYLNQYDRKLTHEEYDKLEEQLNYVIQYELEYYENLVIGRSGKIVWCGTKTAIEVSIR